jgi:hypothetical protein
MAKSIVFSFLQKAQMWYARNFLVITDQCASFWQLKHKRNVYGDEQNALGCGSIWEDSNKKEYRVNVQVYQLSSKIEYHVIYVCQKSFLNIRVGDEFYRVNKNIKSVYMHKQREDGSWTNTVLDSDVVESNTEYFLPK